MENDQDAVYRNLWLVSEKLPALPTAPEDALQRALLPEHQTSIERDLKKKQKKLSAIFGANSAQIMLH